MNNSVLQKKSLPLNLLRTTDLWTHPTPGLRTHFLHQDLVIPGLYCRAAAAPDVFAEEPRLRVFKRVARGAFKILLCSHRWAGRLQFSDPANGAVNSRVWADRT